MTARVCPVHGEYAPTGVCRWCEAPEAIILPPDGVRFQVPIGEPIHVGGVSSYEETLRIANIDEAPPLDAKTILDKMNRAWVRIIRARMQDDAIEATRLVFSPQECGRLLREEHAALRWERVARRWATKAKFDGHQRTVDGTLAFDDRCSECRRQGQRGSRIAPPESQ